MTAATRPRAPAAARARSAAASRRPMLPALLRQLLDTQHALEHSLLGAKLLRRLRLAGMVALALAIVATASTAFAIAVAAVVAPKLELVVQLAARRFGWEKKQMV